MLSANRSHGRVRVRVIDGKGCPLGFSLHVNRSKSKRGPKKVEWPSKSGRVASMIYAHQQDTHFRPTFPFLYKCYPRVHSFITPYTLHFYIEYSCQLRSVVSFLLWNLNPFKTWNVNQKDNEQTQYKKSQCEYFDYISIIRVTVSSCRHYITRQDYTGLANLSHRQPAKSSESPYILTNLLTRYISMHGVQEYTLVGVDCSNIYTDILFQITRRYPCSLRFSLFVVVITTCAKTAIFIQLPHHVPPS
ncbi:hypothetical protein J6590_001621 [Homalodisca vitripennis]|nr:hypothetical protein J6590_001621 [Homalodisca vitripennis]